MRISFYCDIFASSKRFAVREHSTIDITNRHPWQLYPFNTLRKHRIANISQSVVRLAALINKDTRLIISSCLPVFNVTSPVANFIDFNCNRKVILVIDYITYIICLKLNNDMQYHTYMHEERNRYQRLSKNLETNYLEFVAIYFLRRKLMLRRISVYWLILCL